MCGKGQRLSQLIVFELLGVSQIMGFDNVISGAKVRENYFINQKSKDCSLSPSHIQYSSIHCLALPLKQTGFI